MKIAEFYLEKKAIRQGYDLHKLFTSPENPHACPHVTHEKYVPKYASLKCYKNAGQLPFYVCGRRVSDISFVRNLTARGSTARKNYFFPTLVILRLVQTR